MNDGGGGGLVSVEGSIFSPHPVKPSLLVFNGARVRISDYLDTDWFWIKSQAWDRWFGFGFHIQIESVQSVVQILRFGSGSTPASSPRLLLNPAKSIGIDDGLGRVRRAMIASDERVGGRDEGLGA